MCIPTAQSTLQLSLPHIPATLRHQHQNLITSTQSITLTLQIYPPMAYKGDVGMHGCCDDRWSAILPVVCNSWDALSMVPGAWSVSCAFWRSLMLIVGVPFLLCSMAVPVVWRFLRATPPWPASLPACSVTRRKQQKPRASPSTKKIMAQSKPPTNQATNIYLCPCIAIFVQHLSRGRSTTRRKLIPPGSAWLARECNFRLPC